jgi:hypothetical protein
LNALRTASQARTAAGNLSVSFLREKLFIFWTCTTWTEEAAMKSYMISGPHGRVMRHLLHWCDEAATVHWTQDSAEVPSWEEAHRRMQQSGRPSKVNHPSPDQSAFRIPTPVITKSGETRLK